MSRRRVVVTGLGTTSPLGGDVASTWDGLVAGKSGVRHLDADWVDEMPVRIGAPAAVDPRQFTPSRKRRSIRPSATRWRSFRRRPVAVCQCC